MKETFNEEQLCQLIDKAMDSRIKGHELEFTQWDEFQELTKVKNKVLDSLEERIPKAGKEMLLQYDDAYSLLVVKASDYFYEQGFADCLRIFEGVLEKKLQE